jgi:hypothetical protein
MPFTTPVFPDVLEIVGPAPCSQVTGEMLALAEAPQR